MGFPPRASASSREVAYDDRALSMLDIGRMVNVERLAAAVKAGSGVEGLVVMKQELSALRANLKALPDAKRSQSVEDLLLRLDVALATTPQERHEAVRRLPLVITSEPARDGRNGLIRRYLAGGKTRIDGFIHAASEINQTPNSGPSSSELCTDDEPEPCATEQEMNDFLAELTGESQAVATAEAEYNATDSEYQSFCNQNPGSCDLPGFEEEPVVSGPNCIFEGCFGKGAAAAGNVVLAAGAIAVADAKASRAIATGTRVAVAFLSWWTVAAVATVVIAAVAVAEYTDCKNAAVRLPAHNLTHWFEPVSEAR